MTFLTHRWVRGENFWGRQALIDHLKKRLGKFTWILGNRRVGKTSLLRQLEHLCLEEDWGYLPLYLDFQGAGDEEGLKMAILEALDEQEACTEALDLDLDQLETKPFASFLSNIKRSIKKSPIQILFLIDETEELVDISHANPQTLSILRKFFHGDTKISVFMTSSYVLHEVKEPSRTSQFLQEFLPSVPLFPFSFEETMGFLEKEGLTKEDAQFIYTMSLGNPYLVQNLGEKTLEKGFHTAVEELLHSKFFRYFFDSNLNCLPAILRAQVKERGTLEFLTNAQFGPEIRQYLIQSSLISENNSTLSLNPLLERVFDMEKLYKPKGKDKEPENYFKEWIAALQKREQPISAIQVQADLPGPHDIQMASEPPSRDMLQVTDEKLLFHTLVWATPEYVMGQEPNERSHVYLAGLWFSQFLFQTHWVESLKTLDERLSFYLSTPKELNRNLLKTHGQKPKLGMILLKSMAPDPEMRYQNLDDMLSDLEEATRAE